MSSGSKDTTTCLAGRAPRAHLANLWDNAVSTEEFLETRDSGEYRMVRGKVRRNRERLTVLGLNDNHNHDLKNLFKGAALSAINRPGPLYDFYVGLLQKGMRPPRAARKSAPITLTMWKKEVDFDAQQLNRQAA